MEEINKKLKEISNKLDEKEKLEVTKKKLEETNKDLEEKLEELSKKLEENKILEETNKNLENKLEQTSKSLEETNKKLEVTNKHLEENCNKDHDIVSYNVSSSSSGLAYKLCEQCMGDYNLTGEHANSFPIFRKGDKYLSVGGISEPNQGRYWIIWNMDEVFFHHPDNNPTPSTPPPNGWICRDLKGIYSYTSLKVRVNTPTVLAPYRVSCSSEDAPTDGLGNYFPTGRYLNGFPTFRNGLWLLSVDEDEEIWTICKLVHRSRIYHPDKLPTPSTPPFIGWKFSEKDAAKYSSSLSVIPITGEI